MATSTIERDSVVIRFAGDSGDGMQLTGEQFTSTTALVGNDLATLPDFPAEIRAPAGTRAGVSGFQLHFSSQDIFTPGDAPEMLVAMNPAALVANLKEVRKGGVIIVNEDKFTDRDLEKAELSSNPLTDGTLEGYRVVKVNMAKLVKQAISDLGLGAKEVDRCKNFFALGMAYWLFHRPMSHTEAWIEAKFKSPYKDANLRALRAGFSYADTTELFEATYTVAPARLPPGLYRNITGNQALALGLVTAGQKANLKIFLGSYPITPASDILHALSNYKHSGVETFQAEDEIAAVCSAIGASYGGNLGVTTTSGPGLALKTEALGLAIMTELPLVVVDVQRGGPSTGLPTKTEQADLMMALYGRNGEAPMPVVAAATPADCFDVAIEAARIALKYMMPVMVLTDGYLANGSEPWKIPNAADIPAIPTHKVTAHNNPDGAFLPYRRDPETLARDWALPGTPGLEHRIGGLEKQDLTGNVSYDPINHEMMCQLRQARVDAISRDIAPAEAFGADHGLVVVSWGSTFGAVRQAVRQCLAEGQPVAHVHLRHLNPFPANLGEVLARYERVLVPEMNLGQLVRLLRARYLIDAISLPKIQGKPFRVQEIRERIDALLPNPTQQAQV